MRKQKYDGVFALYGHADKDGLLDENYSLNILTTKELMDHLNNTVPTWKKAMQENKEVTLVMYACEAGKTDNSFAQRFSGDYPNVKVIAPDAVIGFGVYDDKGTYIKPEDVTDEVLVKKAKEGFMYVKKQKENGTFTKNQGHYKVFKKGKQVSSFLKIELNYPIVKKTTKK